MTSRLLSFLVTGVLICCTATSGEKLELSDSAWASYQYNDPWDGSWSSHTAHVADDHNVEETALAETSTLYQLSEKQLQKRHYLHYIPVANPESLARPRKRHFEPDGGEPIYELWEKPPMLAKEGITSAEAVWVPQGEPLQVIQQGYSWGSKKFDQSFGRHPRLVPETHLEYIPKYISTFPTHPPPPRHPPPVTSSEPPIYSSLSPSTPSTTTPYEDPTESPYSQEILNTVNDIDKSFQIRSYHPPHPRPAYHHQSNHRDSPRKYYLREDTTQKHKHQHGVRKYLLNTEPTILVTSPQEEVVEVPVITDNEIELMKDFVGHPNGVTQYPTITSLSPVKKELADEESNEGSQKQAHPTYSVPYGYKLQPHSKPPIHVNYKPPPYGHYLHQRPPYPVHNLYHPTPGTIRKYFLSSSSNNREYSTTKTKQELKSLPKNPIQEDGDKNENSSKDLASFDVYDMLRSPRDANLASTSWQRSSFGSIN